MYAVILVPTIAATVKAGENGRPAPTAVAHTTDEPEVQLIEVQIVAKFARTADGELLCSPKLTPCRVRLEPVHEGPLMGSISDITGASNENAL